MQLVEGKPIFQWRKRLPKGRPDPISRKLDYSVRRILGSPAGVNKSLEERSLSVTAGGYLYEYASVPGSGWNSVGVLQVL